MSLPILSQNGRTKSEGTQFNREKSVVIGEALVVCDFAMKKVDIFANTIKSQDLMLDVAKDKINEAIREIEKRDDLIFRLNNEFKMSQEINSNQSKTINQLERKIVFGKWKVTGGVVVGIGIGYGIFKLLK